MLFFKMAMALAQSFSISTHLSCGPQLVSWPSPLYAREKGSGNIVYNELSQRNTIITYMYIAVFTPSLPFEFES